MKIAIVGCGQIADVHIQEAQKIPGVEVAAVCDLNRHLGQQAAIRFGIPNVYTDLASLLQNVKPDVVHITAPPATHLALGRTVLEFGAHAYIEKPFTMTYAEAQELLDIAARAGRLVCPGHDSAFNPAFLRLKQLYETGKLGDAVHVDAVMGTDLAGEFGSVFMAQPGSWVHALPGGIAQNNLSHPLSLTLPFLQDGKPEIHAQGIRRRQIRYGDIRDRFFDEVRVLLTSRTSTAQVLFSSFSRPIQRHVTVHGTEAQAMASLDAQTVRLVAPSPLPNPFKKIQLAYRDAAQAGRDTLCNIRQLLQARLHTFASINELFRRFYLAVEGRGPIPIHHSEILNLTAIMDDIFQQCHAQRQEPYEMEIYA